MSQQLAEMNRALGRIEGQLKEMATTLSTRSASDDERHGKLEARIRKVENRHWYSAGIAAAVAFFSAKLGIPKIG